MIDWRCSTAIIAGIGVVAMVMTGVLRRYALARNLLDIPNARSSHSAPTPRGGGVAIVLSTLLGVVWLRSSGFISPNEFWGILGAGGLVALIGFVDDHRHIAAHWRLLAHFVAAAWIVLWMGAPSSLTAFSGHFDLLWLGYALTAVYLVWMLNLYNFMDGIDGLASMEAITVCLGGALVHFLAGQTEPAMLPLLLAAAVTGFAIWNFPPARIFMGDAGSGFLGIMFGILSVQAASTSMTLFFAWLVLLGVFITDASLTLLRRLFRGERVHQAHRTHAYQHAARRHGGHLPVTLTVTALNLIWLLPLAVAITMEWLDPVVALVLAYTPLLALAVHQNAGGETQADDQHKSKSLLRKM